LDFNIKIADFGFAAPLEGKDGSGFLKTNLGNPLYMAPEIHEGKPYIGSEIDLFASAIILFMMVSALPPFTQAKTDNTLFKMVRNKEWSKFWNSHGKQKPEGEKFFSEDFKDLI